MKWNCLLMGLFIALNSALAQNALNIDAIKLFPTFEHISCQVDISGDDNQNSTMEILFKTKNASTYRSGAKCFRAFPSMIVDNAALNSNFHAGSAMFLSPNVTYDIRIVIVDPDGGSGAIDREVTTKNYPDFPLGAPIISVSANDGADAIQNAIDNANEGSIIEVGDGEYAPFVIEKDSIFLRSSNLHGAIIDGVNTDRGVVTIGVFDDSIRHILLDGFVIRNGKWGIDAQNTQFLTLRNCDIYDVDYGLVNRRANGWEHDQFITNNRWVGRTSWPQSNGNIPGERGIDVRGNNNVISFNTISYFGDGITTDGPPYQNSYSLDVHHNDVNKIVDDLIEVDGMVSNNRVYQNRAWNGRAGISLAPVYGGPAYIFRNEFVNMENSTYKMNRSPAGLYIVHNTTIQEGDGMSSDSGWQNTFMKNNLVFAGFYCFQEYGLVASSQDDWDHNGYYSERAGTSGAPWFKWDNVRYADVDALANGTPIEQDGIEVSLGELSTLSLPVDPFQEVGYSSLDLSLVNSSVSIDTGLALMNVNDPFVFDGKPDLGGREFGSVPTYGHNFTDICGQNDLSQMTWTGGISQSWSNPRNWSPCGVPNSSSNVSIPDNVSRYPKIEGLVIMAQLILGN